MSQSNEIPPDRDWRDPGKPRNPEDDEIGIGGWIRKPDGTWEKLKPKQSDLGDQDDAGNNDKTDD